MPSLQRGATAVGVRGWHAQGPPFFTHVPSPPLRLPFSWRHAEGKAPTVRYEGQYVEGKKQGIGKMSFPNGEKYHGEKDERQDRRQQSHRPRLNESDRSAKMQLL